MDMEKGDGPAVRKKYDINAYPAFLYIDGDGKLVHHDGGYQEADRFLANGQTALSNKAAGTSSGPSAKSEYINTTTSVAAPSSPNIIPFAGSAPAPASGTTPAADAPASGTLSTPTSGALLPANTSNTGMHFTEGSWTSLLARAKKSGKLIFVDANTTWCGPCKQMRKNIFPQTAVAQLYDRNFINVDFDMEKGEGIDFRKKYGVHAYPTFLYIDGDGQVIHKTVGSCEAAEFRQHALDALSPHRNLLYLQTAYLTQQKDPSLVITYLAALKDAYETPKADSVAVAYLESKEAATWLQPDNWLLTKEYVNNATSSVFRALVKNQSAYASLYGQEEVEKKIYQTYLAWPQHYLHYPEKGAASLDQDPFNEFLRQVKGSNYAKKEEIGAKSQLTVYFGLREWSNYAATVNKMLADHIVPMDTKGAEWLYSFSDIINRFSGDDRQVLSEAVKWTKLISGEINGVEPADKATYLDLYATLLEKTGQTDQALQVRKEINQQQLTNAKNNTPFKSLIRIVPKQN
jgi:thioredoxin-related protein